MDSIPIKKKHISFSEFRLYQQCAVKHYLSKVLGYPEPKGEPLVFGSALHSAIEDVIVKKLHKLTFEKTMHAKLLQESYGLKFSEFFLRKLGTQGANIIKQIDFFERYKEYEVVGVEHQLYVPLYTDEEGAEVNFKGIVDLILKHKVTGRILIADWKSSAKNWDIESKKKDSTFFCQLALYKHFYGTTNNIPLEMIDTHFVVLVREPASVETVEVNISEQFLTFTLKEVREAAQQIISNNPLQAKKAKFINKDNCKWCTFHKKVCNEEEKQQFNPYIKPNNESE